MNKMVKDELIECQFKQKVANMREKLDGDYLKALIIADTSGSMFGDMAIVSCLSLATIFTRLVHPTFRDLLLTFDSETKFVKVPNSEETSLLEAINFLTNDTKFPWGGNTNYINAYKNILERERDYRYPYNHKKYPNKIAL